MILLSSLISKKKEGEAKLLLREFIRSSRERRLTQQLLTKLLSRICHIFVRETGADIEARDAVDHLIASSRHYEELARNLESLYLETTSGGRQASPLDKGSEAILDEIQAYMDEHFHTAMTIQQIAEHFGFNYTYLCSLFKKVKRKSPNEYLIEKRIEKAKHLLRTTDLSIKAVGSFVGYEDPYYFSRIFKSVAGSTPSGYRKKLGS